VLRFACIDLPKNQSVLANQIIMTNLWFINVICKVFLVLVLRDVGSPSRHQLHVLEVSFLALEFEVAVDGDKKRIKKPARAVSEGKAGKQSRPLTTRAQPFPIHQGGFVRGVDMQDIRP